MRLKVTIDVEAPDGSVSEQEYMVHLRLDSSPDRPREDWWLESIDPAPPNEYVEERIMELACQMADRGIEDVLFEFPGVDGFRRRA